MSMYAIVMINFETQEYLYQQPDMSFSPHKSEAYITTDKRLLDAFLVLKWNRNKKGAVSYSVVPCS